MNKVFLVGRLVADPAIREAGESKVAEYSLAINRKGEGTDYIRCQSWNKGADFVEKYLKKGSKIIVSGRIRTGSYKNREKKTVYTFDVIVEDIEFAESKKEKPEEVQTEFMTVPEDADLPFN